MDANKYKLALCLVGNAVAIQISYGTTEKSPGPVPDEQVARTKREVLVEEGAERRTDEHETFFFIYLPWTMDHGEQLTDTAVARSFRTMFQRLVLRKTGSVYIILPFLDAAGSRG